jgi:chromosome segregation ATPase
MPKGKPKTIPSTDTPIESSQDIPKKEIRVDMYETEIDKKDQQINTLKYEIEGIRKNSEEINSKNNELTAENETLKEKIKALEETLVSTSDIVKNAKTMDEKTLGLQEQHNKEILELKGQISNLKSELALEQAKEEDLNKNWSIVNEQIRFVNEKEMAFKKREQEMEKAYINIGNREKDVIKKEEELKNTQIGIETMNKTLKLKNEDFNNRDNAIKVKESELRMKEEELAKRDMALDHREEVLRAYESRVHAKEMQTRTLLQEAKQEMAKIKTEREIYANEIKKVAHEKKCIEEMVAKIPKEDPISLKSLE